MRPHYSYDLGYITFGGLFAVDAAVYVEVELNYAANVLLMDSVNYDNYYMGERYSYYGGYATRSPITFKIPYDATWIVVIDNGGDDMGDIEASVTTRTFRA